MKTWLKQVTEGRIAGSGAPSSSLLLLLLLRLTLPAAVQAQFNYTTKMMKTISKYAKRTGWTVVATAGLAFICTIAQGWAEQFTIAVIPDTQMYTMSDANMAGFTAQMNYIATNRVSRNIVFATHLGDMVNNNGGALDQWSRAQTAMNILRDSDVPFGIALGNHDYNSGPTGVSGTTVWAGYFGPGSTYFQGRPWHHVSPGNVPDSYQIFYGADRAFLHIVLEMEPSTASLQWAQQIIQAHPGLPTIVSLQGTEYKGTGK